MASSERKVKFTVSISGSVSEQFDKYMRKRKLSNKSEAIEQAMSLWMQRIAESEDADFYAISAAELNSDAQDWTQATTETVRRNQHD